MNLAGASLALVAPLLGLAACSSPESAEPAPHPNRMEPVFQGTLDTVNGRKAASTKVEVSLGERQFMVVAGCGLTAGYAGGVVRRVGQPAPALGPCSADDLRDLIEVEAIVRDSATVQYEEHESLVLTGRAGGVAVFLPTPYSGAFVD
ncbi:hypothetical protein [Brevundimonas viscosa]|uniref:hypothetical protein n=1 Tax=Brevundimonas viscosa TaxID=871741 RepID=UPI001160D95D|nr:hypothetical protein [Brevundimonas viscosa]